MVNAVGSLSLALISAKNMVYVLIRSDDFRERVTSIPDTTYKPKYFVQKSKREHTQTHTHNSNGIERHLLVMDRTIHGQYGMVVRAITMHLCIVL